MQVFPAHNTILGVRGMQMSQKRGVSLCGLFLFLCTVCSIAFVAGCGGSSSKPLPISVSVSPQAAAIGTSQTMQFTAMTNDSTGVIWTASEGTIDSSGNYTAQAGPLSSTATVTATSKADRTKSSSATVNVVSPGQVTATANVQVAQYTVSPAASGNVSVQFGLDTNYGLTTWMQPL